MSALTSLSILALLPPTPAVTQPAATVKLEAPKISMGMRPIAFAAAPTGSMVAVSMEDGSVAVIDASTRQIVMKLGKHVQPAYAIAWSADGLLIATGDETARVWVESVKSKNRLREWRTHSRGIQKVSFNSIGNAIATTGKDDVINVYNLFDPKPKEAISILGKGANFYGGTYNPKSSVLLATGILGPGGRFYDTHSGKVLGFFTDSRGLGVFDVAFNSTGTRMVSAGRDGNVILWDPASRKRIGTMKGHTDFVMSVAFSPNGKLVASGSTDATVKVWNAVTCQKLAEVGHQSYVGSPVAFTADGKFLLSVNDAGYLQVNPLTPAQK